MTLALTFGLLVVACSATKDKPGTGSSDSQTTAQDRGPRHELPERQEPWRTYRNVQFGYELRYPPDALPDTTVPAVVRFELTRLVTKSPQPGDTIRGNYTFMIEASPNPAGLSPAQWFSYEDSMSDYRRSRRIKKITPLVIDGQRGLSYLLYAGDANITHTFLCAFGFAYEITYEDSVGSLTIEGLASVKPVYQRMLHSIRFIRR